MDFKFKNPLLCNPLRSRCVLWSIWKVQYLINCNLEVKGTIVYLRYVCQVFLKSAILVPTEDFFAAEFVNTVHKSISSFHRVMKIIYKSSNYTKQI